VAWELARTHGLAGFSLGDIARRIGMKTPSLYWYFDSKQAIYDAMFQQGNHQLLQRMAQQRWGSTPQAILRAAAGLFVSFCNEDLARYQLLFQRTIPDFQPSPEAYAVAVEVFESMRSRLASAGVTRQPQVDLWTALVAGLAAQQTSNDPQGERWLRLVDDAVEMFLPLLTPTHPS
jgi:AcrR family transcriptional regulator